MFVPREPSQPSRMFVDKAKCLAVKGASLRYSTWVGSSLSHKHWARLERLASDKCSSLLWIFVKYGRKKFFNFGPRWQLNKTFSCYNWQSCGAIYSLFSWLKRHKRLGVYLIYLAWGEGSLNIALTHVPRYLSFSVFLSTPTPLREDFCDETASW